MPPPKAKAAEAIIAAAKDMSASGLSPGRSGNISVRWRDGMLITASGVPPHDLDPARDVVYVGRDGVWKGHMEPSSEWRFHSAIYEARPDMNAVVHCHSRYATALACIGKPIPAFHYMVAKAGGAQIPLAPYATYGTAELAGYAAAALSKFRACLLANHGQIAIGETLGAALELAEEVETLAAQYVAALTIGQPAILPKEEIDIVAAKFSTYGKPMPKSSAN